MSGIQWVVTTEQHPWVERDGAVLVEPTGMPSSFLQLDRPQQVIERFGASFNEMGWDALAILEPDHRERVLDLLFAPGEGLGLSLCRMPVGANDFSRDWYSYDETPGDLSLEQFDLSHDDQTLVPFIRAAQYRRPDLALWASPWSPPTWRRPTGTTPARCPTSPSGRWTTASGRTRSGARART